VSEEHEQVNEFNPGTGTQCSATSKHSWYSFFNSTTLNTVSLHASTCWKADLPHCLSFAIGVVKHQAWSSQGSPWCCSEYWNENQEIMNLTNLIVYAYVGVPGICWK